MIHLNRPIVDSAQFPNAQERVLTNGGDLHLITLPMIYSSKRHQLRVVIHIDSRHGTSVRVDGGDELAVGDLIDVQLA